MKHVSYNNEKIDIYEFKEARQLIMQLSNKYAGDITAISRGGRGRSKVQYYNYPCSFDIETTTIKPGQLDYKAPKDAPPLAFPYLFQWNIYGHVIMCRHYQEAIKIFNWLAQYFKTALNRRLILFVHNLSYEWHYWRDLWEVDTGESFALDERHAVTVQLKNGLMLRDSYKMSNMSLERLTLDWSKHYFKEKEIMNYSKLRTPYTELDANTLLYSALDVLSLSDAITNFLAARGEHIWTRCPTSTSFIRKDLKKAIGIGVKKRNSEQRKYFDILKAQRVTPEMFKLLLRLARGGNTHANRAITGKLLPNLAHFDIVSSYPAQMVLYPEFPLGAWDELEAGTGPETIELFERNGYCCMFDIVLFNAELKQGITVPYVSISKMGIVRGVNMKATDNGRYIGGLEAIKLSIFGVEWPVIKKQYNFTDAVILGGYFCKKGYLPDIVRRFVLDLYAKKTELKGIEGKEIEYMLAKTYVNGVFGMAYTNPVRDSFEISGGTINSIPPDDLGVVLDKYQHKTSYFMPYAWGAMVACLGRVYLQKMIDAVGADFCYCDTDSVFTTNPEKSRAAIKALEKELQKLHSKCGLVYTFKDNKGNPHELGTIDEEPPCEYFKTFGAKKYITVEGGKLTCTIAGVPKKAGAKIIGSPDNFRLGLNFKGSETGKNCLWYNPAPGFKLHDEQGREIQIYSNVAMLPCDYLLSMSREYKECLSIEGNFHWLFNEESKTFV